MAPLQLRNFVAMIETQFSKKVKRIRSDNGSEFICLSKYFQEKGIVHETSCVHTPQQNGRVERKHRHILNVARALRFQASLPIEYWGECVLTAAYLINRTPSQVLKNKTPFEMLFGHAPGYKHLRVLGCLAYAHNLNHKGDKFASRSRCCVFLGYPYGKKGWKLYDLESKKVFVSRDMVFQEDKFPFAESERIQEVQEPLLIPPNNGTTDTHSDEDNSPSPDKPEQTKDTHSDEDNSQSPDEPEQTQDNSSDIAQGEQLTQQQEETTQLGRGQRQKFASTRLKDYVVQTVTTSQPPSLSTSALAPQQPSGITYPICNFVSCDRFSQKHLDFLVALSTNMEPRSFAEAMKDERWGVAVDTEITSLEGANTWTLEDLPPGKKALGCKWIFTIKYKSDGTIERYKARLVVLGNHQEEGIDYTETFAPVARMTTVRLFLDIAAKENHEVHQMDVHNAFLHGDLEEEVYMKLPPGFRNPGETRVCRLRKSLYGLKQAPRCWFAKLAEALRAYGFKQTRSDYTLFIYFKRGVRVRILVYVDDLIISGNLPKEIQSFKDYLATCFRMKDLGPVKYFLGLEVARSPAGIYLCQRKYATDIVAEVGLLGCRPAGSPIDQNHKLSLADGPLLADPQTYRRLVGRLIYLAAT